MRTYRIELSIKSGFITPWHADTLFGHLCWVAERHDGFENFSGAAGLIELYRNGDAPFILSDGFPAGLLPAPATLRELYLPKKQEELDSQSYSKMKQAKKLEYITVEQFQTFCKGQTPDLSEIHKGVISATTLHNQINRITNTTGEQGSLFERDEKFISGGLIQIYAKVRAGFETDLHRLFELLGKTGFGAKKSSGKGACSFKSCEVFDGFAVDGESSGFASLSHFVPAKDDPVDGAYRTMVKYGKLGEEKTFCGNPFKKPLIMIKPGALFQTAIPKSYYGRMIEGISYADKSVVQYGYAFPVPVNLCFLNSSSSQGIHL